MLKSNFRSKFRQEKKNNMAIKRVIASCSHSIKMCLVGNEIVFTQNDSCSQYCPGHKNKVIWVFIVLFFVSVFFFKRNVWIK